MLNAHLAVFNLEEAGGLNRGLTSGSVKLRIGTERPTPLPDGPEGLRAQIHLDKSTYENGDILEVQYVLANATGDPVRLVFPSGQRFDLSLTNAQSREHVWTWSMNKLFTQEVSEQVLSPGDVYAFTESIRLDEIGLDANGPFRLSAHLALSNDLGDVRLADTRAGKRIWIGSRPPIEEPPVSASRVGRDLDVQIVADSVIVNYRVWYGGGKDIATQYSSGQTFDLVLQDGTGELWRWSADFSFTQAIREEMLISGDTLRVEERFEWPPGILSATLIACLKVSDVPGGALTQDETVVRQRLFADTEDREAANTMARKSDFDSDGTVGFGDFISFAVVFGTRSGEAGFESAFDLDEDGQVGFSDFLSFASAFGSSVTSP